MDGGFLFCFFIPCLMVVVVRYSKKNDGGHVPASAVEDEESTYHNATNDLNLILLIGIW
ncbi:hypothetical protein HYC85_011780 [Camellia sinensis]|uniref:Uncharacterized protein n=1 Tax=Camellia sinensis TaxID=4442 RepID=A0A7J7HB70_CAMSI|nr:hypothetical protein HYC85_011780 [Camellia sinensis]